MRWPCSLASRIHRRVARVGQIPYGSLRINRARHNRKAGLAAASGGGWAGGRREELRSAGCRETARAHAAEETAHVRRLGRRRAAGGRDDRGRLGGRGAGARPGAGKWKMKKKDMRRKIFSTKLTEISTQRFLPFSIGSRSGIQSCTKKNQHQHDSIKMVKAKYRSGKRR